MLLYKYRSLENFKIFVDIILNNRIYAAPFFDLNDPMEGLYIYRNGVINREMVEKIKGEKTRIRICSLSRTNSNTLMWSHYANSHKGVAIGVIVKNHHKVEPVQYDGPSYVQYAQENGAYQTAINILSHKHEAWHYEEESRVFVTQGKFAEVEVVEVILGSKISSDDAKMVRALVKKLNTKVKVYCAKYQKTV